MNIRSRGRTTNSLTNSKPCLLSLSGDQPYGSNLHLSLHNHHQRSLSNQHLARHPHELLRSRATHAHGTWTATRVLSWWPIVRGGNKSSCLTSCRGDATAGPPLPARRVDANSSAAHTRLGSGLWAAERPQSPVCEGVEAENAYTSSTNSRLVAATAGAEQRMAVRLRCIRASDGKQKG